MKKEKFLVKTIDKETIKVEGEKVKAKPKTKAPTWFSEFRKDFDGLVKKVDNIDKKVDENSKNIKRMMTTPTMKKELKA